MERENLRPYPPKNAEVLSKSYDYALIIPYSFNTRVTKRDRVLSFYSAFVINTAAELYHRVGNVTKFIVMSDVSSGDKCKTTGDLMKEALIRLGVPEENIVNLDDPTLNNTPAQINGLANYLSQQNAQTKPCLVINIELSDERIKDHIEGFKVNAQTVLAEELHEYFRPQFDSEAFKILILKRLEKRERILRKLSKVDKRGLITRSLKRLTGPVVIRTKEIQEQYKRLREKRS